MEQTRIDQFAFLAGLRFSSPITNDMYCTQKDFFIWFSMKLHMEPYRSYYNRQL